MPFSITKSTIDIDTDLELHIAFSITTGCMCFCKIFCYRNYTTLQNSKLSLNAKDKEIIREQARKNPETLGFDPGATHNLGKLYRIRHIVFMEPTTIEV